MMYDDRVLELSVEELYSNGIKAINYGLLGNLELAIEEFEYNDVATEAVTKNLLTTYIERAYTFVMNIVRKVKEVLEKVWLKMKSVLTLRDKKRETLILKFKALLADKAVVNPSFDPAVKYIHRHLAFFQTANTARGSNVDRHKDIIRVSAMYRKAMANAKEVVTLKLRQDLKIGDIEKSFKPDFDPSKYKGNYTLLSCRGDYVYLLAEEVHKPVFGSSVVVLNAKIKDKYGKLFFKKSAVDNAFRLLTTQWVYESLTSLSPASVLYRTVTSSVFDEIKAIEHDMEAVRLRELKELRLTDDSDVDDISTQADNVKMHSEIARRMAGISKALMYIANGMLYNWNVTVEFAAICERGIL